MILISKKNFEFSLILLLLLTFIFGDRGRFSFLNIGEFNLNIIPVFVLLLYFTYNSLLKKSINKFSINDYLFFFLILYILLTSLFYREFHEFPIKYLKITISFFLYLSIRNLILKKNDILKIFYLFLIFTLISNFFSVLLYFSQFFTDLILIDDTYHVFIYEIPFAISDASHYVFGHAIPVFTGFFESRTQFIFFLLMQTSLTFFLLKNYQGKRFILIFILIFQILLGLLSFSRGYLLCIMFLCFFYFINFDRLSNIKFSKIIIIFLPFVAFIFLFFISVYVFRDGSNASLSSKFIFNKMIDFIINTERLTHLSYFFQNSYVEIFFGSSAYELGQFTMENDYRGFHNSFLTFFNNFGFFGFILYLLFIFKNLFHDYKNPYLAPNLSFYPLFAWILFGLLHNIYFSIFIIIIVSLNSLISFDNE